MLQNNLKPVQPKTQTYHGQDGSEHTAGRRGGARQDGTATGQCAQDTNVPLTPGGIEDTSPERISRGTKKRNLMQTDGGTQRAVDPRYICGTRCALCSWLLTSGPTPCCLCKPLSCKACPGTKSFLQILFLPVMHDCMYVCMCVICAS